MHLSAEDSSIRRRNKNQPYIDISSHTCRCASIIGRATSFITSVGRRANPAQACSLSTGKLVCWQIKLCVRRNSDPIHVRAFTHAFIVNLEMVTPVPFRRSVTVNYFGRLAFINRVYLATFSTGITPASLL